MSKLIKCPKCEARSWSSDYWTCSTCSYSESREWALLEDNKDYFEGRDRGDEPQEDLSFWKKEQEDLTEEMINECLPKGKYNWELDCNRYLNGWGSTIYYENDPQEVNLFVSRHAKDLIEKGKQGTHWEIRTFPNGQQYVVPLYPYGTGSQPTQIRIANWALTTEGEYKFDGQGYFPTVPHEAAHASPEVKRHPKFEFWRGGWKGGKVGKGHDDIWRSKAREFHYSLVRLGYKEKVRKRFKELRKIKGEDDNKYSG